MQREAFHSIGNSNRAARGSTSDLETGTKHKRLCPLKTISKCKNNSCNYQDCAFWFDERNEEGKIIAAVNTCSLVAIPEYLNEIRYLLAHG